MNNTLEALLNKFSKIPNFNFSVDEESLQKDYQGTIDQSSSFAIKLVSFIGSFLGAILLTAFLVLMDINVEGTTGLILGLIYFVLAIFLKKRIQSNLSDGASLSCFMMAFLLIGFPLMEMYNFNQTLLLFTFIGLSIISLFLVSDFMLNFAAILCINLCLLGLIYDSRLFLLKPVFLLYLVGSLCYIFLREAKLLSSSVKMNKSYNALKAATVISFAFYFKNFFHHLIRGHHNLNPDKITFFAYIPYATTIILCFAIAFAIYQIQKRHHIEDQKIKLGLAALCLLTFAPAYYAPAIAGSIFILILSLHSKYKTGIGLAAIALIYSTIEFYYYLNTSLLTKSILFICTGILLLISYVILNRFYLQKPISDLS